MNKVFIPLRFKYSCSSACTSGDVEKEGKREERERTVRNCKTQLLKRRAMKLPQELREKKKKTKGTRRMATRVWQTTETNATGKRGVGFLPTEPEAIVVCY